MKIKFVGMTDEFIEGVNELKKHLEFEIADEGAIINVIKGGSGYRVLVKDKAVEIEYEYLNDFFRAFAIAVNALQNGETIEMRQVPAFRTCGMMIDASRRAVPTVESIKKFMRNMACMGLNRIMLYTEDTYEM